MFRSILLLSAFLCTHAFALSEHDRTCKEGNFSLPSTQQPTPLISFGELIINQFQTQIFVEAFDYINSDEYFIRVVPNILYGITDNFSVYLEVPFAPRNKSDGYHSSGIDDLLLQFEYAFFSRMELCSADQATIVANVGFPTGSASKIPPTGFGSFSYFIGTTYNHTEKRWLFFTSYGANFTTTTADRTKFGNQYLYQFGFGRNFATPVGWILNWLVEIDGTFSSHDKIRGIRDPNSGGNVILVTPSFWASNKILIFQAGVGYEVFQHLFGHQPQRHFLIAIDIGWTL